jgi:membrane-associated phospholipid phosphatase
VKTMRFARALGAAAAALALLALWAEESGRNLALLPVYRSLPLGMMAAGAGLALASSGLYSRSSALYRVLPHPVSAGLCLLCLGPALALGSAGGLWLVTPMAALAALSWYLGREEQGNVASAFLHLPADENAPADWSDRVSVVVLVLLAWLVLYEAVMALGIPRDAVSLATPWEKSWPVWEWTELFYIGTYPFVAAVPFVLPTRRQLRLFTRRAWTAMAINLPVFLLLPFISPPRPFVPRTWLGDLLLWERRYDSASNAFPSFHVTWAILAALAYSRAWPRWRFLWWALGAGIALSTITTGMHTLADVAAAVAVCRAVARMEGVRGAVGAAAKRLSRAWRRAPLGPFVVHHHGLFAGLAAAVTVAIAGGLWSWSGTMVPRDAGEAWGALAVLALAAPWGSAVFRLRLLVKGEERGQVPARLLPFLAWDLAIALFLLRLWSLDAAPSLVAGTALLLAGCGRFVEGKDDRVRQRQAALAFAAGALFTCVPTRAVFPPVYLGAPVAAAALAAGCAAVVLLGVEFRLPGERRERG